MSLNNFILTLKNAIYSKSKGQYTNIQINEYVKNIIKFFALQQKKYQEISNKKIINKTSKYNEDEIMLPNGTLIHCAGECDFDKLLSIRDKGIMAGDFVGIPETNNGETYFCADFYKKDDDLNSKEFFKKIEQSDISYNRSPFGEKMLNSTRLAFIIQPSKEIDDLLQSDMYLKKNKDNPLQKALNLVEYSEIAVNNVSAIPYGLPGNAISGIIAGDLLIQNKEYMLMLKNMFPECFIIDREGRAFYSPELSNEKNIEISEKLISIARNNTQKKPNGVIERANERIQNLIQNSPYKSGGTYSIAENISRSMVNSAKKDNQMARDIQGTQKELKTNYKEIENPTQDKDSKDVDIYE